jgi:hypothetical protein
MPPAPSPFWGMFQGREPSAPVPGGGTALRSAVWVLTQEARARETRVRRKRRIGQFSRFACRGKADFFGRGGALTWNLDMIDQANLVIKASRRKDGRTGDRGDGLEGLAVDELEVVDGEVFRSIFAQDAAGGIEVDGGVLLAGDANVLSGPEGAVDAGGIGSLGRGESGISGRKSEAVIFTDGWVADDLDRHVEVPDHAMDESELLEVLFSKDRKVGLEDIKKLQDDGQDAIKVSWTGFSAEVLGQEGLRDEDRMIGLVERLFFREEGNIDARGFAQGEIIAQGLRVIREVGDAVKLDGIDKDRDRHGSPWANVFAGCA